MEVCFSYLHFSDFPAGSHKGTGFRSFKWTVPEKRQTIYSICGCKHTKNPPFCDGTHVNLPMELEAKQASCAKKDEHPECCKMCTNCGWVPDFWWLLKISTILKKCLETLCGLNGNIDPSTPSCNVETCKCVLLSKVLQYSESFWRGTGKGKELNLKPQLTSNKPDLH